MFLLSQVREDNKPQNLTRQQHLHFIHHGDRLHNMFLLKTCLKNSSWHLHSGVFILWMVNHDVVKSSWATGPECVYITTLGAELKLNFNKKSMCLYNVHDRKKKTKKRFPAQWCVWIWQGACSLQTRGVRHGYGRRSWFVKHKCYDCCAWAEGACVHTRKSLLWYLFIWEAVLPSANPGYPMRSSRGSAR